MSTQGWWFLSGWLGGSVTGFILNVVGMVVLDRRKMRRKVQS